MAAAIGLRAWTLHADDYPDETSFRQAVIQELAASEHLSFRLGIAVVSAPIRAQRVPNGDYETVGWTFRTATVPAIRFAASEPEVERAVAEVEEAADEALEADAEPTAAEPEPAEVAY